MNFRHILTNLPIFNKQFQPYDKGYHVFDTTCHCGKLSESYIAYKDHVQMKHPKEFRRMNKTREWEQIMYDWRVHPDQIRSK